MISNKELEAQSIELPSDRELDKFRDHVAGCMVVATIRYDLSSWTEPNMEGRKEYEKLIAELQEVIDKTKKLKHYVGLKRAVIERCMI